MSVRFRILTACVTLTVLTGALGLFTLNGEKQLGRLALRMYDQAFMSVDFFRSAQVEFANLRCAFMTGRPVDELHALAAKVTADLDIAIDHATSPEAQQAATALRQHSAELRASLTERADMGGIIRLIDPLFEAGGEQFAQDGFAFRLQAEQVAHDSETMSKFAIAASLLAALLITVSLTRSIVPPLRRATAIAREIARGNLNNTIVSAGSQELKHLFGALGIMQGALAEREAAAQQVEHLAHHDMLTGLSNRLAFSREITAAFAAVPQHPFALLLLDLDRFKPINDTLGHAAGDELLVAVAKRITRSISSTDFVAHIGGDEFAVIHRDGNLVSSEQTARRLVTALSRPFGLANDTVTIGASVGFKLCGGDNDVDDLLQKVDFALYATKNSGRGGWRNFEDCASGHLRPGGVDGLLFPGGLNSAEQVRHQCVSILQAQR